MSTTRSIRKPRVYKTKKALAMYAVIKTGGKQYRVQPGDVLVVEKLEGDIGSAVRFDEVLMLGGADGGVTLGAPLVEGAFVSATLVETRRGDKVKVFKKIRRQGYRRTKGHRQTETVLRVIGLDGAGQSIKWDGEVDLTPRSVLNARARNLAPKVETAETAALSGGTPNAETSAGETVAPKRAAKAPAAPVEAPAAEAAAPKAKKAKAAPTDETNAMVEQPVSEVAANLPETSVDAAAADETGSMAGEAAPKKPRAKKAKPQTDEASDDTSGAGE